jgi:BirA family biotin operon repressor/biotin-[acetyl-CoA-carboxylase] ligase
LQWKIVRLDEVDSTQKIAQDFYLHEEGIGTVLLATSQTDGKGRHDKKWISPLGGLYFTIVLGTQPNIGLIPLMAGVAVAKAIKDLTGLHIELKWPNDILVNGKKIGGILTESIWWGDKSRFILLGVGVNVNNIVPFGIDNATSIYIELGEEINKDTLLSKILEKIDHFLPKLESDTAFILSNWRGLAYTLGKFIDVKDTSGNTNTGIAVDVDSNGFLLLDCKGEIKRVFSI